MDVPEISLGPDRKILEDKPEACSLVGIVQGEGVDSQVAN
jgi:hypothetical protein